jgi:hypothetical protein
VGAEVAMLAALMAALIAGARGTTAGAPLKRAAS